MKKSLFLASATLFALSVSASAQQRNNQGINQGNNQGNNRGQNGGAALPLPQGVKSLLSIDAYNVLLAEIDRDGQRDFAPIIVKHVYSGGIARLFGGSSIPTEQFVSPGVLNGGNNNGNGGGGNNRFNNAGNSGIGGNNGTASNFGGGNGGFGGIGNTGGFNSGGTTGGFGGGFNSFQIRPTPGRGN